MYLENAHIRELAARPAFKRSTRNQQICQRIDGLPWDAGIYTFNAEGSGIETAQRQYNNFLKRMQLRKGIQNPATEHDPVLQRCEYLRHLPD